MKLLKTPVQNLHHLKFESQYDITSTFLRLQEFYESDFDEIRGQYFSLEKYMDLYAKQFGNFTYYTDWNGFNVPGHIVKDFFELFHYDLSLKEQELYKKLKPIIESDTKFYIIGTWVDGSYLDHEIAHGMYYLNHNYRDSALKIVESMPRPLYKKMKKILNEWGYTVDVLDDEIQAYCSTSSLPYLVKMHKSLKLPYKQIKQLKKLFLKTRGYNG